MKLIDSAANNNCALAKKSRKGALMALLEAGVGSYETIIPIRFRIPFKNSRRNYSIF